MYYKDLPCIYHPELNITNFCQDQDCLMPLCPSCIRQHTEYHEDIKTKPSYFNIYEALAETDTLITNYMCNLEKDKKRNSELIFKINRLPAIIHDKISQAKAMAIKIIEQSFSQLQRDALQTITKLNEDMKVHSLRKSEALQESIIKNLEDLYDLAEGLKTESCLSDMIFFLKEKRFEVEDLHTQMARYLYENQNHEPYIQISKQAQQSLAVVIHRMLKMDPKQRQTPSQVSRTMAGDKALHEQSYHISLTPSKVKKSMVLQQQKRTSTRLNPQINVPTISRPKNSSYQNYNDYQEHVQRSRQTSREKGISLRGQEDSSFRQISIKEKERKHYYPNYENDLKGKNADLTQRNNNPRFGNPSRF